VDQVQRALDNVRDKFRRTQGGRAIDLDYLIYCPAHRLVGTGGAPRLFQEGEVHHVLDGDGLLDPAHLDEEVLERGQVLNSCDRFDGARTG